MTDRSTASDAVDAAFSDGRRVGLATGALALSIASFINLLGFEKSILAAVLAILALRGATASRTVKQCGRAALAIAAAQFLTVVTVLFVFHDKLVQLIKLLEKLG